MRGGGWVSRFPTDPRAGVPMPVLVAVGGEAHAGGVRVPIWAHVTTPSRREEPTQDQSGQEVSGQEVSGRDLSVFVFTPTTPPSPSLDPPSATSSPPGRRLLSRGRHARRTIPTPMVFVLGMCTGWGVGVVAMVLWPVGS